MGPAVRIHKPFKLVFNQVVLFQPVGNKNSLVIPIECKRQLMVPPFLVFIYDDWTVLEELP